MPDHPTRTLSEAWDALSAAPPPPEEVVDVVIVRTEEIPLLEGWRFFPGLRIVESPSGETILHAERMPSWSELERLLRAHLVGLAHPDTLACAEIEQSAHETRAAVNALMWARSRLGMS